MNAGVPGRQTLEVGSLWPTWGEDVCIELAFHRRALQEGFVPAESVIPDTDPSLVHYYECAWNEQVGETRKYCSFHIRVDTDAEHKRTSTVNLRHIHPIDPVSQLEKKVAMEKIRILEAEVKEEAVLAIGRIRAEGDGRATVRQRQDEVLEDVRIAAGQLAKDAVQEEAVESGFLSLRGSGQRGSTSRSSTSRRSARFSAVPDTSHLVDLRTSSDPPCPEPARKAGTLKARCEVRATPSRLCPSSRISSPNPLPNTPNTQPSPPFGSRPELSPDERRSPAPEDTLQDPPQHGTALSIPVAQSFGDPDLPFFDTPSWPSLEAFRSALAGSGLDYREWLTPAAPTGAMSPPQLLFRCAHSGCPSRFVIDLEDGGAYKRQLARSVLDHKHDSMPIPVSPLNIASCATPIQSSISALPSRKRSPDELSPLVNSCPKRTAYPTPESSRRGSGGIEAKVSVGRERSESSAHSDASDDVIILNSVERAPTIRESAPIPEHSDGSDSKVAPSERARSSATRSDFEPNRITSSPPSLYEYLQNLDETGSYDFSCYHSVLREGLVETPQQLRLFLKSERRVSMLMDALRDQDEAEARRAMGGATLAVDGSIRAAVWRREVFRDLLTGSRA